MQTAPDIIFSRKADGARDYISERFYEYTGAPAGSASGFGWLDYVHPEDKDRSMAQWMQCVQSGENYESEYRMKGKDGLYRWFRARAVAIRNPEGQIMRWYGTCSDIHDSKMLEQSMRASTVELEKKVDERTAALRRLSGRLMALQDQERRRIARELHDGLGQELVAAKMMLDMIPRRDSAALKDQAASEAIHVIDRAMQAVRSISHLLHPPLLDEVGLLSAVQWSLDGLTKRSGIETSFEVRTDFPRLTPELETTIFRIIQEALADVFRHAKATKAWVTLAREENQVIVTVRDNGKGIGDRTAELHPSGIGVGVGGMRERARELGGDLRLINVNPGTLLEAIIPCAGSTPEEACAMVGRQTSEA